MVKIAYHYPKIDIMKWHEKSTPSEVLFFERQRQNSYLFSLYWWPARENGSLQMGLNAVKFVFGRITDQNVGIVLEKFFNERLDQISFSIRDGVIKAIRERILGFVFGVEGLFLCAVRLFNLLCVINVFDDTIGLLGEAISNPNLASFWDTAQVHGITRIFKNDPVHRLKEVVPTNETF
jgi:hypothetical protein